MLNYAKYLNMLFLIIECKVQKVKTNDSRWSWQEWKEWSWQRSRSWRLALFHFYVVQLKYSYEIIFYLGRGSAGSSSNAIPLGSGRAGIGTGGAQIPPPPQLST